MVNLVSVAVRALLFGGEGRKLNTKAVNSPCSTVVEYQPVAVVCAGDTATVTTYTQTRTECANGCITPEQCSQPPVVTVTTTVPGTTPGTSTVTPPADCDRPCTTSIIVTTTPEPSATTTQPPDVTVTTTHHDLYDLYSSTAHVYYLCRWVKWSANELGYPAMCYRNCLHSSQGGAGGLVSGKIRVIPGQPVIAFAGGAGAAGRGGESQYGSGGSAPAVAGGGGGASALMINTVSNLVAVAGGGGGLQASSQYSLNAGGNIATASFDGPPNADHDGRGVGLLVNGNYVARAFGGKRGTTSGSGAGGTWSSTTSTISRANGNPGIGTQGGAGVPGANNHGLQAGTGGGGGGFYGGGSGGRVYYQQPNVRTGSRWFDHAGSGGGGGSFTNIYTFETSKGVSAPSVGSIRVVFY
ncbi:hypothetical protein NHJ6243_009293 [Beauveria neobassiana]